MRNPAGLGGWVFACAWLAWAGCGNGTGGPAPADVAGDPGRDASAEVAGDPGAEPGVDPGFDAAGDVADVPVDPGDDLAADPGTDPAVDLPDLPADPGDDAADPGDDPADPGDDPVGEAGDLPPEATEITGTLGGLVPGNARIPAGEAVTVVSDTAIVQGDLAVEGALVRDGAGFTLIVEGDLTLGPAAVVRATLPDAPGDDEAPVANGLVIVVRGNVRTAEGSALQTNGHLVLTDDFAFVPLGDDGALAGDAVAVAAASWDEPPVAEGAPPLLRAVLADPGAPVVAGIRPVAGLAGATVTFEATLEAGSPSVTAWSWDFRAGATPGTSTDAAPAVSLGVPGAYVGTLTVMAGEARAVVDFVFLVFDPADPGKATWWNLCGGIQLNPPPGVNPATWMFVRAGWAGCWPGGGAPGPGPGPGPRPAFAWVFPDGKDAKPKSGTCGTVTGRRGGNAPSALLFVAGSLVVQADWDVTLGSGGRGGDATAACGVPGASATAIAGAGGRPGRLSVKAGFNLGIPMDIDFEAGSLIITPGDGGDGGDAVASTIDGLDGCPGQTAGTATAQGGPGHPTFFGTFAGGGVVGGPPGAFGPGTSGVVLWSLGAKKGMSNVSVAGTLHGGAGGDATATAGAGGDGTACGCAGGDGGAANATGGDGGLAEFKAFSAAAADIGRMQFAPDTGGDGGDATAGTGKGGDGGDCPRCAVLAGGPAGKGGDATADSGKGGEGTEDGTDGAPGATPGGGGTGGDGCGPAGPGAPGTATELTGHANPVSFPGPPGAPGADTCCPVICGDPSECGDGYDCTVDDCVETVCTHTPDPGPCDDGDPCTDDLCEVGRGCVNSFQDGRACADDGNPCTTDTCTAGVGCHAPLEDGTPCDREPCLLAESCAAGNCQGGSPRTCPDDGLPCVRDQCDPATGLCGVPEPDGVACSDGDACTVGDRCVSQQCQPTGPLSCPDDGDPCTTDACNPSTGACGLPAPGGTSCDDGDPCTTGDQCQEGACAGAPRVCVDTNPCTLDTCDPATGDCFPAAPDGTDCETDADLCTTQDCQAGQCEPKSVVSACAPDGNPCTDDTCHAGTGCYAAMADDTPCVTDEDPCTTQVCTAGACAVKTVTTSCVPDGDPCTTDACHPGLGCYQPLPELSPCDDADPCTTPDRCVGGACSGAWDYGTCPPPGTECPPARLITETPYLEGTTTYVQAPVSLKVFASGPGETVASLGFTTPPGTQVTGVRLVQSKYGANPIIDTEMLPMQLTGGCLPPLSRTLTLEEYGTTVTLQVQADQGYMAAMRLSAARFPVDSFFDVFVTIEYAGVTGLCGFGTTDCSRPGCAAVPCSTLDRCQEDQACQDGVCQGTVTTCSPDGNPCTSDLCNPANGLCDFPPEPDGTTCSDADACTDPDTCQGGTCEGAPRDCDDADPCTNDGCDFLTGCFHAPGPDSDGDGVPEVCDNCPFRYNPAQADTDANGIGDVCEVPGSQTHVVDIVNFAFEPSTVLARPGDTVQWLNTVSTLHTVTHAAAAGGPLFDSGTMSQGAVFQHTFFQEGTFQYFCDFHPSMIASVGVTAP